MTTAIFNPRAVATSRSRRLTLPDETVFEITRILQLSAADCVRIRTDCGTVSPPDTTRPDTDRETIIDQ